MGISVVFAFRNRARTIERALNSLEHLASCEYELIAVDGESSDESNDIVQAYEPDRLLRTPPRGVYNAWNLALQYCSNDWVLFLNSDDALKADVSQLTKQASSTYAAAVFAAARYVNADGTAHEATFEFLEFSLFPRVYRLARGTFPFNAAIYRTNTVRECGGFNSNLTYLADRHFVQRLLADKREVNFLPELCVYQYYADADSLTLSGQRLNVANDLSNWASASSAREGLLLRGLSGASRVRRLLRRAWKGP